MAKRVKAPRKPEFNPIEGEFDLVSQNNFSYESIPTPRKLTVYENMQHVVREEFTIEEDAELRVDGSFMVEE